MTTDSLATVIAYLGIVIRTKNPARLLLGPAAAQALLDAWNARPSARPAFLGGPDSPPVVDDVPPPDPTLVEPFTPNDWRKLTFDVDPPGLLARLHEPRLSEVMASRVSFLLEQAARRAVRASCPTKETDMRANIAEQVLRRVLRHAEHTDGCLLCDRAGRPDQHAETCPLVAAGSPRTDVDYLQSLDTSMRILSMCQPETNSKTQEEMDAWGVVHGALYQALRQFSIALRMFERASGGGQS